MLLGSWYAFATAVVPFVFRNIMEMVFVSHDFNSLLNLALTLNVLPK